MDGKVADLEKHMPALSAPASAVSETLASSDAVEDNLASYNRRFKDGYGINIPGSQYMRVLRQVVEKQLNVRSRAFHDYGAGMCGKAASLASMNGCDTWPPYGVLPEANEQCKARVSHEPDEFAAL